MTPVEIPPGVVSVPTKASNSANWIETQLIRWVNGKMQPIGGWDQLTYSMGFASRCRYIHQWFDTDGVQHTAYLCEAHCYVDTGGTLTDISPTPAITAPYGSDVLAGGYGDDVYSLGTYGTVRPDVVKIKPITPCYKLDNWGELLLAMTSADGRLLFWDPQVPASDLDEVLNAPINNRTFQVTPERFVVLFGMGGDFRTFGWCDQEDIENWNFADVASKAGFYNVEPAAPIVSTRRTEDGIIFHTTKNSFIVRFIGLPYIYDYDLIGAVTTPISAASIDHTPIGTIWFSEHGFWQYNGANILPLPCPVFNLIDDDIDLVYARYEAAMMVITSFSELWFFYPANGSRYNDRYVIYNYRDGWWANGKMARSCGFSSSYTSFPMMSDGTHIFLHESTDLWPGVSELPFAETHVMNIASGAGMMTVNQLMPDVTGNLDDLRFSFRYKNDRSRGVEKVSPLKGIRSNGYVDIRKTGRDFRMRIETVNPTRSLFTMGQTLIDAIPRGKR